MQNFRVCFNRVLLLVLLAAAHVRSNPAADPAVCQTETTKLNTDSFSIFMQVDELDTWTEEMRAQPNKVCDSQAKNKVTCNLDYVNTTETSDWCLGVPNTIYVETTFIVKCDNEGDNRHVFYSVRNRPACFSKTCYDGYDMTILEDIQRATFDGLLTELKNPNMNSEWGYAPFDT